MNLLFITAGEKIAGIIYQPESLQGMRENLDRILQFMASKKIRMHQITSKEILEGNLKAVMRLILALAAHYKPQSVKHHDVSYDNIPDGKAVVVDKPDTHINGEIRYYHHIIKQTLNINCLSVFSSVPRFLIKFNCIHFAIFKQNFEN